MRIDIDGRFHEFCDGCRYVSLVKEDDEWVPIGDGKRELVSSPLTCENYSLCERLWKAMSQKHVKQSGNVTVSVGKETLNTLLGGGSVTFSCLEAETITLFGGEACGTGEEKQGKCS